MRIVENGYKRHKTLTSSHNKGIILISKKFTFTLYQGGVGHEEKQRIEHSAIRIHSNRICGSIYDGRSDSSVRNNVMPEKNAGAVHMSGSFLHYTNNHLFYG